MKIAANAYPGQIDEGAYYKNGRFGVDKDSLSDTFANSLLFKLAYYRFGELKLYSDYPPGVDFARRQLVDANKMKYNLHKF